MCYKTEYLKKKNPPEIIECHTIFTRIEPLVCCQCVISGGRMCFQHVSSHGDTDRAPPADRMHELHRGRGQAHAEGRQVVPCWPPPCAAPAQPLTAGNRF